MVVLGLYSSECQNRLLSDFQTLKTERLAQGIPLYQRICSTGPANELLRCTSLSDQTQSDPNSESYIHSVAVPHDPGILVVKGVLRFALLRNSLFKKGRHLEQTSLKGWNHSTRVIVPSHQDCVCVCVQITVIPGIQLQDITIIITKIPVKSARFLFT